MWTIEERETYVSMKNSLKTIASTLSNQGIVGKEVHVVVSTNGNVSVYSNIEDAQSAVRYLMSQSVDEVMIKTVTIK